ncbi:MAG TPA: bifunctional phosphoribosylaminoimidazolecarboxamide formyltransferase/IMP cyclohydrolase [Bacteroidales bacterium]|jgi:phosphoribosylaminoimidazolecarboxamide formyltransferase/IMP cyclohydrolase|nr:bifunctional phosphoribosylaminoimidazolecarboxamide formyltransferase/IMP cyclohydrolase [Bacteroidales bacterium]HOD88647.1 bifunctional phosphoribosylaminoimidazolecarboxamide formyltransferase/IMP cyclohydrolase [Bacteroidales bacterium]HOE37967.1 bifunctional phosphoribosylaminoimidazolecarboxamide formyltransferase/IMP cyclohydrolase [Bacteroidales bacterium]HOR59896.1 bifunctional phosphoribosylaminoimidazolecarboxamide formyltransferase/IMP cyclohydrolase [Bacteroidales bacterium]HPL
MEKKINSALISVYHKDGLEIIVRTLEKHNVKIYSTGGTWEFINNLGIDAIKVEDITGYPSIFDGRVKTLHPKVFGGILFIRDNETHQNEVETYEIPSFDLVIVDLYPFEETVKNSTDEAEIIEKIDIGGISLIRAAAKNFNDVLVVSNRSQYQELYSLLEENACYTSLENRKKFALESFGISSAYDTAIFNWFDNNSYSEFKVSEKSSTILRYGENPHQKAKYFGDLSAMFEQLHGKEISYNNILDIDAAVNLISEFEETTCAILKHNNACGIASRPTLSDAWDAALEADPVSAFGGIIITNQIVDQLTAEKINKIFFEIIIAPDYTKTALEILKQKKNRIILIQKYRELKEKTYRSVLNGVLVQDRDAKIETEDDFNFITNLRPNEAQIADLLFANKVVKNTKSNAIVLVKNQQLLASGTGQTSRVDALKQAITKARSFDFDLQGAVMASDAFFPFSDSVEIAHEAGINSVIQPGGSIRDDETIEFCNKNNIAMVFTGIRHFKH